VCRTEFSIPADGLEALPGNFFMQKLLDIQKLGTATEHETKVCDVCGNDGAEGERGTHNLATVYCVDCQQNLCEVCSNWHRKMKALASHETLKIGAEIKAFLHFWTLF